MKKTLILSVALTALALPALAQSQGEMTFGVGVAYVSPKSDTGKLAGMDSEINESARPSLTFEYFIRDNLGVEVLAATPFSHDVSLAGLGEVGTVKHLPPTVSLNYHFPTGGAFSPFVGLGLNFTGVWDEEAKGALAGKKLQVKNSVGVAAHLGADYWLAENRAIRADLRWIDIDADVLLDGAEIGTVNIDPTVAGISYLMKF